MKFLSPTGAEIVGTLEILKGCANATEFSETGEPEYEGDTEIWWDEQKTVYRGEKMVYVDDCGEEWTFDQLVPEEDEPEEA